MNFAFDRKEIEKNMNEKVREFISTNRNSGVRWKIDGHLFNNLEYIPNDMLEKYVYSWMVNQVEGIIEISTEYHQ